MSLVGILIALIVLGLIWWLVQTYILPRVAEPFRTIVIVVMVVIFIIWLLSLIPGGPLMGRIRLY